MLRIVATLSVAGMIFFCFEVQQTQAQVVTTYYAPAPSIGVVPVRRGLFGLRHGYVPVVTGTVAVPVTTAYAPAPVMAFYAPTPVTRYYAPAPVPVTAFYAPAPPVVPVKTYYAPRPLPVSTYYMPGVIIGR